MSKKNSEIAAWFDIYLHWTVTQKCAPSLSKFLWKDLQKLVNTGKTVSLFTDAIKFGYLPIKSEIP